MRIDFRVRARADPYELNWVENATACAVYIDRNVHIDDVIIFVQACFGESPPPPSRRVCLIIMDRFWVRIILTLGAARFGWWFARDSQARARARKRACKRARERERDPSPLADGTGSVRTNSSPPPPLPSLPSPVRLSPAAKNPRGGTTRRSLSFCESRRARPSLLFRSLGLSRLSRDDLVINVAPVCLAKTFFSLAHERYK